MTSITTRGVVTRVERVQRDGQRCRLVHLDTGRSVTIPVAGYIGPDPMVGEYFEITIEVTADVPPNGRS